MNGLKKLVKSGVIAVVRGDSAVEALAVSEAIIAGGMLGIEVTYTIPNAETVIRELRHRYPHVVIGAGTVLEKQTARLAILAGAEYIVGPTFDKEIAKLCNLYQIPYLPGCMTPTEVATALQYGVDVIKLFPASVMGASMVSAIKGPLPQANIMATGGINLENLEEWQASGVLLVGVGGNLLKGNLADITLLSSQYVQTWFKNKART